MNTPAHVLLALAIAGKPDAKVRNTALITGALFPDITMIFMVGWERWVNGLSLETIFREVYFSDFWQEIFAVNNSAPVFAVLCLAGILLKRDWLWAFGLAALLHVLLDLPLHNDDGHPHFWPFSDWIYSSPVSYWDPDHHGVAAGLVEGGVCVVLAALLLRRFRGIAARLVIVVGLAIELVFSVFGHFFFGEG